MNLSKASILALGALGVVVGVFGDVDRQGALRRKRDLMYYRLGYESCFWPRSVPFSLDRFPTIAAGSGVSLDSLLKAPTPPDSIVYVPGGAFAYLTAKIPSCDVPSRMPEPGKGWLGGFKNVTPDFHKAGTDPLAETQKWCAKNGKEFIVGLPANMTDHASRPIDAKPVVWYNYFFSPFQAKNAAALQGAGLKEGDRLPYGIKLGVDYGTQSVRDRYLAMARDIADKYAPDGIMLDFMNEPSLFRVVAAGGVASTKECGQLTDMIAKIRTAVNAASAKKSKAILLSVRVPDSIPYARDIGIDLQAWMDQKLVDFIVAGGAFHLNPWKYMADITAKSGIPWYASFDISGILVGNDSGYPADDERPGLRRQSSECFNARAYEALRQKAAGVMMSNPYHWHTYGVGAITCGGGMKALERRDKRYEVTYRNPSGIGGYLKDGDKHRTLPVLVSGNPVNLAKGSSKQILNVWDDFNALKKQGVEPTLTLTTEVSIPSGMDVSVTANGKNLKLIRKQAGSQAWTVPPGTFKTGPNEIVVKASGKNKRGQVAKLGNVAVDVRFNAGKGGAK